MTETRRDRALVLGASMAGLLAARVLAEVYADVVVLDRDEIGAGGDRRGVPQGRHAHALLARGQQALDELFPGLTADLVARGVPAGDVLADTRLYFGGHRLRPAVTGLTVLSASRPCLEDAVRARVRGLPQVTFAPPCDVVGLVATPDARRVTAARILRRADGSAEETLPADLVVDATGRGSRAPAWLEGLGYGRPDEERVRVDLTYTTRRYRLPPQALGGALAVLQGPTPDHPRGGVLARLEDGQSMLTLAGMLGDRPPRDPEGFLAFARSLRFPDIFEAVRDAEPLDDPVAFRFPASVRRRYERLARTPKGFVAVGDGVCSFNPVYGQGMTVAALEALALRDHLRRYAEPRPRRFHRAVSRVVDTPWDMAAGADLAFPGAEGRRSARLRLAAAYVARLHAAAAYDARLSRAFVRVSGLVDRPEALLRPGVALRVLRGRRRGSPEPPAPVRPRQQAGSQRPR